MKRVIASLFGTITGLVLLLNFKTHGSTAASAPPAAAATGPAATPTPAGSSATSAATSAGAAPATSRKTVTGNSIDTRWGPVQVRITVSNGKLVGVTAVDYPWNNGRDQEINSYAIPALNKEAIASGNAKIDMISGATYTSTGYIQSLQSALDKVGL